MIKVGDRLPGATFKQLTGDGMIDVDLNDVCAGKKVVLFAVPGAFTPTCTAEHLPSFVDNHDALKARGVDTIVCVSVNDGFVLDAWSKAGSAVGKVVMLADWNAAFTRAVDLVLDGSGAGLGIRSLRYSMIVDDGVVTALNVEEAPGQMEVTGADRILAAL